MGLFTYAIQSQLLRSLGQVIEELAWSRQCSLNIPFSLRFNHDGFMDPNHIQPNN
jgi:hypothetical protein